MASVGGVGGNSPREREPSSKSLPKDVAQAIKKLAESLPKDVDQAIKELAEAIGKGLPEVVSAQRENFVKRFHFDPLRQIETIYSPDIAETMKEVALVSMQRPLRRLEERYMNLVNLISSFRDPQLQAFEYQIPPDFARALQVSEFARTLQASEEELQKPSTQLIELEVQFLPLVSRVIRSLSHEIRESREKLETAQGPERNNHKILQDRLSLVKRKLDTLDKTDFEAISAIYRELSNLIDDYYHVLSL